MKLEQLCYIVEVAKSGSITIAAQNLYVSISAISQSISSLEEELGTKIFLRSRQGTELTQKGHQIVAMAQDILVKLEKLKEEAREDSALSRIKLKVALIPDLTEKFIVPLQSLKARYPNVEFDFKEMESKDIITAVQQHKMDLGLIVDYQEQNKKTKDLIFEPLIEGSIQLYAGKNSSLGSKKKITPQELLDQDLVFYDGEPINMFVESLTSKYGAINILFSSNQTEILIKTVRDGVAISFAIDSIYKNHPSIFKGDIVPIELINHDSVKVSVGWLSSKTKHFSSTSKRVLEYLKAEINLI